MSWESTTSAPPPPHGPSGPHAPLPSARSTAPARRADAHVVSVLGEDLPPWAWARWAGHLATCLDTPGTVAGARHRSCLRMTTEVFHHDLLQECLDTGVPLSLATRRVGRESWVFRQWLLHERGALASWLAVHAHPDVRRHAGLAREWAGAPMGGHRMGGEVGGRRRVFDLARRHWFDVLDLGAEAGTGWVIGRLVPSGRGPTRVFDQPPLPVPAAVAHRIAHADEGTWLGVLADALHAGTLDPGDLLQPPGSVFTDVPGFTTSSARRLVRLALEGSVPPEDGAVVGAAVLTLADRLPGAERHLLRDLWSGVVPEPAAMLLRREPAQM